MRGEPPQHLVSLLARLKLATEAQVRAMAPRVRRLAGDLPDFESVWVDALQQARLLTPLQAAEINAGRGESLCCGPYVIQRRLSSPQYADCYAAQHVDTGRAVRLYCVRRLQIDVAQAARDMAAVVEQLAPLAGSSACVADDAGMLPDGVWAACSTVDGITAADWMVENGRFPPRVVLHMARAMLTRLADLQLLDAVHGDIGAAGLIVRSSGHVVLPMPALRGVVRPSEGYSFNDLPPEAYDYLAPERIADGEPPTVASDLYACACLWWHLLAGRPPFAGGNSLARLKAAHAGRVVDVRQLAPEVPEVLANVMASCLSRDPSARPSSFGQVLSMLGPASRGGHAALARALTVQPERWRPSGRRARNRRAVPRRMLVAACAIAVLSTAALAPWWAWRAAERNESSTVATHDSKAQQKANGAAPETPSIASDTERKKSAMKVDRAVAPATAVEPVVSDVPADLVLPAGKSLRMETLNLAAGQRVRGQAGMRPLVSVPRGGLRIACEEVRFEGIDFVCDLDSETGDAAVPDMPMLTVAAQAIELRGCSFSTTTGATPVAIVWSGAYDASTESQGEIVLNDCVFQGMAAVVDCQGQGGLTVELDNSLCVASGPLLRLHASPRAGQTFSLALDHVTTRGDSAVLECRCRRIEVPTGHIAIAATDSALVTNPHGGLLIFAGTERPDALLASIAWSGQGSLVMPETAVALWRSRPNQEQALAEDEIDVAGLVRSDVQFAGAADGPPADSRIIDWQAPLRSDEPPGANTDSLFLPKPTTD